MKYQTYIGMDVGKFRHSIAATDNNGDSLTKPFEVAATARGWQKLQEKLALWPKPIQVGMEATGHYFLPYYEKLLAETEVEPVVFNPLQVAAYRKQGIRGSKTDKLDSLLIAKMLRLGEIQGYPINDTDLYALKQLTRLRTDLADSIATLKRRILGLLDRVFPEYRESFTNVFNTSSTAILSQAVLPEEIAALDTIKLTKTVERLSRKKKTHKTVTKLQQDAKVSIGIKAGADAIGMAVKLLLVQIEDIEKQMQVLEKASHSLVNPEKEAMLVSIPGISRVSAASILAEVGGFERFIGKDGAEKLVALAGIDAKVRESGVYKGQAKMSKRGSPYLRRALRQAAFVATCTAKEPMFADIYQEQKDRGKHHEVALSHVAHTMIHVIYSLLRDKRKYQQEPPKS